MHRFWVEWSDANPELVQLFHAALVCFLAFDSQRVPRMIGTGFIVDASRDWAVIVTAKHVLGRGVSDAQNPDPRHAPSAIFLPENLGIPSLDPKRLRAIWRGRNKDQVLALNICHASYNEALDLAVCIAIPQTGDERKIEPASIVIDAGTPAVGEQVFMVSIDELGVDETCPPNGSGNRHQELQISRRTNIRSGVVTGRYEAGYRQYKWPCFTTSIPAKAGMSGGLVGLWRPGQTVAACGVVCADNSTKESHSSYLECGESVVGCLWPVLALQLPDQIPIPAGTVLKTIYEKMVSGHLTKALDLERVVVRHLEDGGSQVQYHEKRT